MSDYEEFIAEKRAIDRCLAQGYSICGVTENLSGDHLQLAPPPESAGEPPVTLHFRTANARKYWTSLLIRP